MTLIVVGASHQSAPMSVLEALAAVSPDDLAATALASPHVAESLVVATCNRVEVYAEVDRFHAAVDELTSLLAKAAGLPLAEFTPQCYVHYDERAAQHLFEVGSGLDSMVVGEQQILGQIRGALARAQDQGTAGREINEAAQAALRVGKRVRTDTGLDAAGANVVTVAYTDAFERLAALGGPGPESAQLLVVGAGSLSGLAVAHAGRFGVAGVTIAGRTATTVDRLAAQYRARGADLADLAELLADADMVVCCTGAVGTVISRADVTEAMARRPDRPLMLVDLALPHDTEPDVAAVPGVDRLDLAQLGERPAAHPDSADAAAAAEIVAEELAQYLADRASRAVEPVLISLRGRATAVVDGELQRLRERVGTIDADAWAAIEHSLRRTVNTLMHTPTVRMKELATDPDGQRYADALNSLFDLSVDLVDSVVVPRELTVDGADAGPAAGSADPTRSGADS